MPKPIKPKIETLTIDNFSGMLTNFQFGDINSGRSLIQTCAGQNPFLKPGQLTWSETPIQIDAAGSVITDLVLDAKERVESGVLFVYAIGHTGRVYKIQVNDPTSYNPDYDHPVLLATLATNSPTFTRGGNIEFFGSTEKLYIGHDMGVTSLNFDGTGEAFIGTLGSWTQTVPRPLKQFLGNLYVGNGSNIAQVLSAGTVASYTQLSPGFPPNTQVRDIDVSPDGTYLEMIVSRLALWDITSGTQQTVSTSNSESYIFKWNGTDIGYTAFDTFPSFSLDANIMFQNYQYTFGTDQFGMAVFDPKNKFQTIPESPGVSPHAVSSTGNILNYLTPIHFKGVLECDFYWWGSLDFEVGNPLGLWDLFFMNSTAPETDIVRVPLMLPVSNTGLGSSTNGYSNGIFSNGKIYFSTLEVSNVPTTKYRFYKWRILTSPQVPATNNALIGGYYQTQSQMFSKRKLVKQVRVYGEPWQSGASFQIDLIGTTNSTPIPNASQVFTVGTNMTVGADFAWYNPAAAPTYSLGVAITNLASTNHVINKIEIDITDAGQ